MQQLKIRKLADKSVGTRLAGFDQDTGESVLINPATNKPEPWPLAGIRFEGDIPTETAVSQRYVQAAQGEGWLVLENQRVATAPGGPPHAPYSKVHTFVQADALIFKTVDGDVRFAVTQNPGKYESASEPSGYVVDWTFKLLREEGA